MGAKGAARLLRDILVGRKSIISEFHERYFQSVSLKADAEALGASAADLEIALSSQADVVKMKTMFGVLHLRPKDTDMLVVRQVLINREYDLEGLPRPADPSVPTHADRLQAAYQGMLDRGSTPIIVDAGANIGAVSMWFAKLFPEATILAVEPDPGNASIARLNIGQLKNARLIESAIGAESGQVKLQSFDNQGWGARTTRGDGGINVVTINDLVADLSNSELLAVKIDIEGFESDLFSANTEWVDAASAIFIEPHDWLFPSGDTSQSLQKALLGKARDLLLVGENIVFMKA